MRDQQTRKRLFGCALLKKSFAHLVTIHTDTGVFPDKVHVRRARGCAEPQGTVFHLKQGREAFGCDRMNGFMRCEYSGSVEECNAARREDSSCECHDRMLTVCYSSQLSSHYNLGDDVIQMDCALHVFFGYVNCFESEACAKTFNGERYLAEVFEDKYRLDGLEDIQCFPLSGDMSNANPCHNVESATPSALSKPPNVSLDSDDSNSSRGVFLPVLASVLVFLVSGTTLWILCERCVAGKKKDKSLNHQDDINSKHEQEEINDHSSMVSTWTDEQQP